MSILAGVTVGQAPMGARIVIAGVEKVGKTTLACNAPRALLVPLEIGFAGVQVAKTPMLDSYDAVMQLLGEVKAQAQYRQFPYKSLVFDSSTALERLIHDKVLSTDPAYQRGNKKALTMEAALGGYGKAYQFANELFANFLRECDALAVYGGINIIFTCHVFAARVVDPAYGEYDTWDLLLHSPKNQKAYGKREMVTQWADMVGFLHEPLFVTKGDKDSKLAQGVSANRGIVLGVSRTPGYVAGNRYGLVGEIPIPKDQGWNHLAGPLYQTCGVDLFNRD